MIADLASIHLPGWQFTATGIYGQASWFWAFPNTLKMAQLVLYKPWLHDRLSIKFGYQDNDCGVCGHVGGRQHVFRLAGRLCGAAVRGGAVVHAVELADIDREGTAGGRLLCEGRLAALDEPGWRDY